MKYAALFLLPTLATITLHGSQAVVADGSKKMSYKQVLVTTTPQQSRRSAILTIASKDQLTLEQENLRMIQLSLRKKRKALRKLKDRIGELENSETTAEASIAKLMQAQAIKQLTDLRLQKELLQTKTQQELAHLEGAIAQLACAVTSEPNTANNQDKQEAQEKNGQQDAQPNVQQPKSDDAPKQDSANKSWLSWPFTS